MTDSLGGASLSKTERDMVVRLSLAIAHSDLSQPYVERLLILEFAGLLHAREQAAAQRMPSVEQNSWRRIGLAGTPHREVLYPYTDHRDGQADIGGRNADADLALIAALRNAFPQLREALLKAEQDSARLDWLEEVGDMHHVRGTDFLEFGVEFDIEHQGDPPMLREAIDAARSESSPAGGE